MRPTKILGELRIAEEQFAQRHGGRARGRILREDSRRPKRRLREFVTITTLTLGSWSALSMAARSSLSSSLLSAFRRVSSFSVIVIDAVFDAVFDETHVRLLGGGPSLGAPAKA